MRNNKLAQTLCIISRLPHLVTVIAGERSTCTRRTWRRVVPLLPTTKLLVHFGFLYLHSETRLLWNIFQLADLQQNNQSNWKHKTCHTRIFQVKVSLSMFLSTCRLHCQSNKLVQFFCCKQRMCSSVSKWVHIAEHDERHFDLKNPRI